MAKLVVVSFRLGGTDGVSIEAKKWIDALSTLGHQVSTIAGEGEADTILPELAMSALRAPTSHELQRALADADLVIVENMASLPLNVPARDALYQVLEGRPALFRHHDLAWQRALPLDPSPPRINPLWRHVTINERSQRELHEHGVESALLRNSFDCEPPSGRRVATRLALGITSETLILFPTRAIPRKNVAAAFELAASLGAALWLLGPAEDGYDETLNELIENSPTRVLTRLPEGLDIHDAYAASDLVVMPSTWEGFGNPVLESVTHRRALAAYPYPVLEEIRSYGFEFFGLEELDELRSFLEEPDERLFEHNAKIAREHFNVADLPARLSSLLETWGLK